MSASHLKNKQYIWPKTSSTSRQNKKNREVFNNALWCRFFTSSDTQLTMKNWLLSKMPHSEPQSQQLPILYAMGVGSSWIPSLPDVFQSSNSFTSTRVFSGKEKSFREILHFSEEKIFFAKIFAFCLLFQKLKNLGFCEISL